MSHDVHNGVIHSKIRKGHLNGIDTNRAYGYFMLVVSLPLIILPEATTLEPSIPHLKPFVPISIYFFAVAEYKMMNANDMIK